MADLYPVIQEISEGEEGDRISIYVSVRNESTDTGGSSTIDLEIDGELQKDKIDVSEYDNVPPGERRFAGILNWYTEEGDAGTHDVTVSTVDHDTTVEHEIGDATIFDVEIEDVRGIEVGFEDGANEVEVDWWVENNTGESGSTDITLNVDDTQEDIAEDVQFAASQERTGTLTWDAEGASIGEYDLEVTTDDDSAGQGFVVESPDETGLDVIITDTETVQAGNEADIDYTVSNRQEEGLVVHDVWLEVDGTEMDRDRDVSVDQDDQVDGSLQWPTTNADVGETDATVYTGFSTVDDTVTGQDTETVTVESADPDPQYVTDGFITMSPRDVQGSTRWNSENDWNQYDERQNIEITEEGTIRLAPPPAPSFFDIYLLRVFTPEAGEEAEIRYGVRNTGDETDTKDVWLEIEGEGEVDREEDVELEENESYISELYWQTDFYDVGSHTAVVHTEDDSQSIEFSVDEYVPPDYGELMYVIGSSSETVFQYGVSEAFDVTTASLSSEFNVSSEDDVTASIVWDYNGTKMYVVGGESSSVYEYDVLTAFDVTTASLSSEFDVSSESTSPTGLSWDSDGEKMYVTGQSTSTVYEYGVSEAFDVTTASYSSEFDVGNEASSPQDIEWDISGSKMYIAGQSSDSVYEYDVSTAFDVTTASHSSSFDVSGEESGLSGVEWNSDGTKMYVIGFDSDSVYEYDVSTAFDVTTASYSSEFDVSGEESSPNDISWNGLPQYE